MNRPSSSLPEAMKILHRWHCTVSLSLDRGNLDEIFYEKRFLFHNRHVDASNTIRSNFSQFYSKNGQKEMLQICPISVPSRSIEMTQNWLEIAVPSPSFLKK